MGFKWSKKLRDLFFGRKDFTDQMTDYIDKKYETRHIRYNARKRGYIDIRDVFKVTAKQKAEMKEYFEKLVAEETEMDIKAQIIAEHITKKITYVSDPARFNRTEYWADPYTIFKSWRDDCDGYAVLICYAWGLVGIPRYRRYVCAGDVFDSRGVYAGGHAYALYLTEEEMDFYPMEGSFYPSVCRRYYYNGIPLRKNKYYGNIWFATNEVKSYKGEAFKK